MTTNPFPLIPFETAWRCCIVMVCYNCCFNITYTTNCVCFSTVCWYLYFV